MAEGIAEKLEKVKEDLKTPPKLSEVEKKKITATFEALKEILDDTLEIVLEKDRAEAFRYTNLFVAGIQQVDVNFIGGVKPPKEKEDEGEPIEEPDQTPENILSTPKGPVKKPDFLSFTQELSVRELKVGNAKLDCFIQFPEVGEAIVCADCSRTRMKECIRMEDPTVNPDDDYEMDVKAIRKEREALNQQ